MVGGASMTLAVGEGETEERIVRVREKRSGGEKEKIVRVARVRRC